MKHIFTFLALALILAGLASADFYPLNKNIPSYVQTDVGGATNREGSISIQTIPTPGAANTTAVYNDLSCSTTVGKNATQLMAAGYDPTPDVARCISITPSASFTGNVYINGTDISRNSISEKVAWSASSSTKSTTKAFASITSLNATTDAAKTFDIGYNDLLGLNSKLSANTVLLATLGGTRESTAPTVTVSSTVLSANTVDLNSALNGGTVQIWYIV